MNVVAELVEVAAPWFRFAIFSTFTLLVVLAASLLNDVLDEKFYDDSGKLTIEIDGFALVHFTDICVHIAQIIACAFTALSMIQVPNREDIDAKIQFLATHEAIFLVIASGINSNVLAEKLFESNLFQSVYDDGDGIITNDNFHEAMSYSILIVRFVTFSVGMASILVNLFVVGTNQVLRDPPRNISQTLYFLFPSVLFLSQIVYSTIHFVMLMHVVGGGDSPRRRNSYLEFIIENVGDLSLSIVGFILVWHVDERHKVNKLATTLLFNTFIMGFVGVCRSTKNAYSMFYASKSSSPTTVYLPLVFYAFGIGGAVIASSTKNVVRESIQIFWKAAGGRSAPTELMWRIAIALGVAATVIALFSTQAQWFTFSVQAGTIPREVGAVARTVETNIEDVGAKAFDVIQKLDPCAWNHAQGNTLVSDNVTYTYGDSLEAQRPNNGKSSFSLSGSDIQNYQCSCANLDDGKDCPCNFVNGIRGSVTRGRQAQQDIAANGDIARWKNYSSFDEIPEDSSYVEEMRRCRSKECDVVLAIAVASEASLLASGTVFFIPGLEEGISAAAWFAQMGNRIGHNVIKYAVKAGQYLVGLRKRLGYVKPLFKILLQLESTSIKYSYTASMDSLFLYAPVLTNGLFCFVVGFWRRKNTHTVSESLAVVLSFYLPLVLINAVLCGLMYIFPTVVETVCGIVPPSLSTITPTEHVGFSLLRRAYIISTASAFLLLVAGMLEDVDRLGYKFYNLKKVLRMRTSRNVVVATSSPSTSQSGDSEVKRVAHIQAAFISAPVIALLACSYAYDWEFVRITYSPAGPLLNLVQSFHGHTSLLEHARGTNEYFEENALCGLVGKGAEAVLAFAVKEVNTLVTDLVKDLEAFADSVVHFSDIISSFRDDGLKAVGIFDRAWNVAEKTLVLIMPAASAVVLAFTAIVVPRDTMERQEMRRTAKQFVLVSIYYNIALLILLQQLFASISNIDLHLFKFKFEAGPLVFVGYVATALNTLSMFYLFAETIFQSI